MNEEVRISGDPEALARAVLEEARGEAAALLAAAGAEAAAIAAAAEKEAAAESAALLAEAAASAEKRRAALLASAPVEAARVRAALFEEKLEAVKAEAARLLSARETPAAELAPLAAQAIAGMEGSAFVVLAGAGASGLRGLAPEIERLAGKGPLSLAFEAGGPAGGVEVRDAEGRRRWDNGFAARLERLWPAQRVRLAGRRR